MIPLYEEKIIIKNDKIAYMSLKTFDLMKKSEIANARVLTDEELKKLQKTLLEITADIIDFCESNNIDVYLGGGTALGAIRHNGFIPWDDDVDLNMPRKDYDKFLNTFENKFGDKYYIKTDCNHVEKTISSCAKVVKKNTIYKTPFEIEDNGISVDIFIIENTYNSFLLRTMHGVGCTILRGVASCKIYSTYWNQVKEFYMNNKELYRKLSFKKVIGNILFFITKDKAHIVKAKWYMKNRNNNSKYCVIPDGRGYFFGETYVRNAFLRKTYKKFCKYVWPITNDYKYYLVKLYGEKYMEVPRIEDIERHSVIDIKF